MSYIVSAQWRVVGTDECVQKGNEPVKLTRSVTVQAVELPTPAAMLVTMESAMHPSCSWIWHLVTLPPG